MIKGGKVALMLLMFYALVSFAQESKIGNLTGNAKSGRALYRRYCITCHGVHGDGAGENAPISIPNRVTSRGRRSSADLPRAEAFPLIAICTRPSAAAFITAQCHHGRL